MHHDIDSDDFVEFADAELAKGLDGLEINIAGCTSPQDNSYGS